jgi:hypothetical protein
VHQGGAPAIENVLEVLRGGGVNMRRIFDELMEDARTAVEAAERVRTG